MPNHLPLSDNARAFLARNPTMIGVVAGHWFFEHPTMGDESPLVVITPDGKKRLSDFWELPSVEELTA
jgi:hypothetical protein